MPGMPLHLVPPAEPSPVEKVRQRVRRMPKGQTVLQCPTCASRDSIEGANGVMKTEDGRFTGGRKTRFCAYCLAKGKVVEMQT